VAGPSFGVSPGAFPPGAPVSSPRPSTYCSYAKHSQDGKAQCRAREAVQTRTRQDAARTAYSHLRFDSRACITSRSGWEQNGLELPDDQDRSAAAGAVGRPSFSYAALRELRSAGVWVPETVSPMRPGQICGLGRQAAALRAPLARDPRGHDTSRTSQVQQQPTPRRLLLGLCFQVHFRHYQQGSRIVPGILADSGRDRRPFPAQWSRPIRF
jgi:hypothetical protein